MAAKKLTADQKLQATARKLAGSQYDTAINASSKSIAQSQADRPEAARRIQGYFEGFKPLMDGGVDTESYKTAKQILASKDTAGPSASGGPSYSDKAKEIYGKYADNTLVNRQQGMDAQRMALGQRARQDVQNSDNRYANRLLSSQNQLTDLQGRKSGAYTSQLVGLRATAENQRIAQRKADQANEMAKLRRQDALQARQQDYELRRANYDETVAHHKRTEAPKPSSFTNSEQDTISAIEQSYLPKWMAKKKGYKVNGKPQTAYTDAGIKDMATRSGFSFGTYTNTVSGKPEANTNATISPRIYNEALRRYLAAHPSRRRR